MYLAMSAGTYVSTSLRSTPSRFFVTRNSRSSSCEWRDGRRYGRRDGRRYGRRDGRRDEKRALVGERRERGERGVRREMARGVTTSLTRPSSIIASPETLLESSSYIATIFSKLEPITCRGEGAHHRT